MSREIDPKHSSSMPSDESESRTSQFADRFYAEADKDRLKSMLLVPALSICFMLPIPGLLIFFIVPISFETVVPTLYISVLVTVLYKILKPDKTPPFLFIAGAVYASCFVAVLAFKIDIMHNSPEPRSFKSVTEQLERLNAEAKKP